LIERIATVRNRDGIHCRPSTVIVKSVIEYQGSIRVFNNRGESDLKSVLTLMALELLPGDTVTIQVSGPQEDERCAALVGLFETRFDFPARRKAPAAL